MAQESDDDKTEEPTQKRLEDARLKGDVLKSQEVNHLFSIAALGLSLLILSAPIGSSILSFMQSFFENSYQISLESGTLGPYLYTALVELSIPLALLGLLLMIAALAANLSVTGFIWSPEALKLNTSKLNPLKGLKRMFGLNSVMELIKGIFKICIIGGISTYIFLEALEHLENFIDMAIIELLAEIYVFCLRLVTGVLLAVMGIGLIDYLYKRYEWMKKMRMSMKEVKDEYKQTEGSPEVKQRIRRIRMERYGQMLSQQVQNSDVIVTNPTHVSVGLKYDSETMDVPIVTCLGGDNIALRIREFANEFDIPIVRNPPLARSLYSDCDEGDPIPVDLFRAVSAVISYVFRLQGRM